MSIFGERLAEATGLAKSVPFPNALNGTQVSLGDIALPVQYVSANQVNALIPYSLSASTNHPLLVQRNGTASVPLDVTVADVLPAIYTTNQSGQRAGGDPDREYGHAGGAGGCVPGVAPGAARRVSGDLRERAGAGAEYSGGWCGGDGGGDDAGDADR